MKRQNKKGNLKKKRKYNDLENDNFYDDDKKESESLTKKSIREVQSADLLNAQRNQTIISDEAFSFASEVAKKSHLEVKPQQNENNKSFLGDDWMKMFKGCQVLSNCEDK